MFLSLRPSNKLYHQPMTYKHITMPLNPVWWPYSKYFGKLYLLVFAYKLQLLVEELCCI